MNTTKVRCIVALSVVLAIAQLSCGGRSNTQPIDTPGTRPAAEEHEGAGADQIPAPGPAVDQEEGIKRRDHWFYDQRTTEGDEVPARAYETARRTAMRDEFLTARGRISGTAAIDSLTWTELGPHAIGVGGQEPNQDPDWVWGGPTPYSGRVSAIANDPTNAQIAYIGTSGGGVWKTTNGGVNWTPLFDKQPSLAIGALAIDPNNTNVVYAATGESNSGTPSYFGAGVFRSKNGGSDWDKLPCSPPPPGACAPVSGEDFHECHIAGIGVKRDDSKVILVAASGYGRNRWEGWFDRCSNPDRTGIWRSDNGGESFTRVLFGQTGPTRPTDLASSPNDPAVWYAAFHQFGIWKSTNSGANWSKLSLPVTPSTGRIDIDVASATNARTQVIYAAVADSAGNLEGVYRSLDGGSSPWTKLQSPRYGCVGAGPQCDYDVTIAADPSAPASRAFFGGVYLNRYDADVPTRILYSTLQCFPYVPECVRGVHADFHALSFDKSGHLWIGNDGGIWRTADKGTTATNLNADLGTAIIYPGISGRAAGPLYAGMQDNGSARFSGARAWTLVSLADGFFTAVDPANPYPAYVEVYNLNVTKLTAAGPCNNLEEIPDTGNGPFNSPLVMHPTNRKYAYAGSNRILRTTNADSTVCPGVTAPGETVWSAISPDLPGGEVTAIGPAPNSTDTVYAATNRPGAGLHVIRPGFPWTNTQTNGLPSGRSFTDIAVHPTSPGTAWVTVSGFVDGQHLYGTTNYGGVWTDLDNGLPNSPANAVAVDTRTNPATIYVGTDVGVYASNGATWSNVNGNLPNTGVMDLLVDIPGNKIIAATFGRGAWSAPVAQDPQGPPNDAQASATVIGSLPYAQTGLSNALATVEASEPAPSCATIGKTLWWRFTPSSGGTVRADTLGSNFDTVLAIYPQGSSSSIACDDDAGGAGGSSSTSFTVTAGQTYLFQVGGFRDPATQAVASGTLNLNVAFVGPANDAQAGATVIGSLPYTQTGLSNAQATVEGTEPAPSCATIGKTLWWRFTPSSTGTVQADTLGSNFDTVLAVYPQGSSSSIACDDDAGGAGGSSSTSFSATAGQTYLFQVGGFRDPATQAVASGTLNFRVSAGSDSFGGATVISAIPYSQSAVSNGQATTEAGEPVPGCAPVGKTVWWRYTPAASGTLRASTVGSNFDTVLAVYRGTALGALTQVGCDDDGGGGGGPSIATFPVTAGQTYYFQVGGYKNSNTSIASGSISFSLGAP